MLSRDECSQDSDMKVYQAVVIWNEVLDKMYATLLFKYSEDQITSAWNHRISYLNCKIIGLSIGK